MVDAVGRAYEVSTKVIGSNPVLTTNFKIKKMKEQIFVDGDYDYDYAIVDDNKHTLYYSNVEHWTSHIRGEIAFQIEDDGNGLKILSKFSEKKRIDYSESEQLYILLKLINTPCNYEIGSKRPL